MIKFYFHPTPNPMKVALMLEETGLSYELVPVDTRKGEQLKPDYMGLNPNAKTPTLTDGDAVVFDSNAILMYLAEKTGQFLPTNDPKTRGEFLSWLMFVATGIGPYSGQCVHFNYFAPEPKEYAVNRYRFEAQRHWGILNDRLKDHQFMVGDAYTIVDMAVWGWARMVPRIFDAQAWQQFPAVKRHLDEITARPAAKRAEALQTSHAFKADMDAEARAIMFRHTVTKVA